MFGSTRHGPRAIFRKFAKLFNDGREINLLRPSECRMAGEVLQFLRVLRLKTALQATTRDQVFVDYKKFGFVTDILNSSAYWDSLFTIIQACYPIFRILRIADTMIGGMDKLYFYVRQTDRLFEPAMKNVMKAWFNKSMPHMELSQLQLNKDDKEWLRRELYHFMYSYFQQKLIIFLSMC